MRAVAAERHLDCLIDSAGTAAYHVGNAPDPRAIETARAAGVDISRQRARQLSQQDFFAFTHIFALDTANLAGIRANRPRDGTAKISLLLDALDDRKGSAVADPYYGDLSDFQAVWEEVTQGARAIEAALRKRGVDAQF